MSHTPAILKTAIAIRVGDFIVAGGYVRIVTDIVAKGNQRQIWCDNWSQWYATRNVIAVVIKEIE